MWRQNATAAMTFKNRGGGPQSAGNPNQVSANPAAVRIKPPGRARGVDLTHRAWDRPGRSCFLHSATHHPRHVASLLILGFAVVVAKSKNLTCPRQVRASPPPFCTACVPSVALSCRGESHRQSSCRHAGGYKPRGGCVSLSRALARRSLEQGAGCSRCRKRDGHHTHAATAAHVCVGQANGDEWMPLVGDAEIQRKFPARRHLETAQVRCRRRALAPTLTPFRLAPKAAERAQALAPGARGSFDLLHLDGHDLRACAIKDRKAPA